MDAYDVIVVGAGAAGLAAARALKQEGARFLVLEARDRVGGRAHTLHDARSPVPVELGAEFIHGRAPVTRRLLLEAGLADYDAGGEQWRAQNGELGRAEAAFGRVGYVMEQLEGDAPDRPFAAFLSALPPDVTPEDRTLARRFVEGFYGADSARIGTRGLAALGDPAHNDTIGRAGRPLSGYTPLLEHIARNVAEALRLRAVVTRIAWERGRVRVTIAGETNPLEADAAIVTLPVGVLQTPAHETGGVAFDPDPPSMRTAVERLAPGVAVRVACLFRELFWEAELRAAPDNTRVTLERAHLLYTPRSRCNVWWTQYPVRAPLLVAWSGGPPAGELLALPHDAIVRTVLDELAQETGIPKRRLDSLFVHAWVHDWLMDPYTRGAYAWALVGGEGAPAALNQPVSDTLFFAGEATATAKPPGTVEGALVSGEAAVQMWRLTRSAVAPR